MDHLIAPSYVIARTVLYYVLTNVWYKIKTQKNHNIFEQITKLFESLKQ